MTSNSQEIELCVFTPEGVYLHQPQAHRLTPVAEGRLPGPLLSQRISDRAGAPLLRGGSLAVLAGPGQPDPHIGDPEVQKSYCYVDTGLAAQNVSLFAASQGLAKGRHIISCRRSVGGKSSHLKNGLYSTWRQGHALDALCKELSCQPGELLEFVPGEAPATDKEALVDNLDEADHLGRPRR